MKEAHTGWLQATPTLSTYRPQHELYGNGDVYEVEDVLVHDIHHVHGRHSGKHSTSENDLNMTRGRIMCQNKYHIGERCHAYIFLVVINVPIYVSAHAR